MELIRVYKNKWRDLQEELKTDPEFLHRILGKSGLCEIRNYCRSHIQKNSRGFIYAQGLFERYRSEGEPVSLYQFIDKVGRWSFGDHLEGQRLQYYKWLLDSALLEADEDLVGRVVNTLKKEGVYDKTIIIVMADHGNEYKEHGHIGHGILFI